MSNPLLPPPSAAPTSMPARLLETLDRANLPLLASALSFDAMLALIPIAILGIAGLGVALEATSFMGTQDAGALFTKFLPAHVHGIDSDPFILVEGLIEKIRGYRSRLTWLAVPAFLWFSTRLFSAVRVCLSQVFQVRERSAPGGLVLAYILSYLIAKGRDLLMVAVLLAMLLVNTVLSGVIALLTAEGVYLEPPWTFLLSTGGRILGEGLTLAFGVGLFFMLYRFASPKRMAWRGALLASGVATVGFEIAKRLYGLYLATSVRGGQFSVDANVGAALLFVLWIWYMSLVFLIGAAVADVWDRTRAAKLAHVPIPPSHPPATSEA
ncbi:MAG: YihY/virulence factor BrkB family protein [Gemmatimonadales bacterium]|nr:YihY/virulence factor BrkB family protein [Gemmatimonadales bacterium]